MFYMTQTKQYIITIRRSVVESIDHDMGGFRTHRMSRDARPMFCRTKEAALEAIRSHGHGESWMVREVSR